MLDGRDKHLGNECPWYCAIVFAALEFSPVKSDRYQPPAPDDQITAAWNTAIATTDSRKLHPAKYGYLSLRPLSVGRDDPMRWFVTFPKKIRSDRYRRLKSDVCIFTKYDHAGAIMGRVLAVRVGGILFTGGIDVHD